jgi:hypothetical protein
VEDFMKRTILLVGTLLALISAANVDSATRVNILWIGNSLTQSPWCIDEGWLATQVMANTMTPTTNLELACYGVMKGATSLASHWSQQSGFNELNTPIVRKPSDRWATENVEKYDFIVLQTFVRSAGAALAAESTAMVNYCNLALSKGTRPVIFLCWDNPSYYTAQTAAFDSCYAHYKSQGALLAPLFDIHQAIDAEKPTTYLYGSDTYLHVDINGAYLNVCVFNYLFTHIRPTAYDISLMPTCADIPALVPEKSYLATKAEAALSRYYSLSGTNVHPGAKMASTLSFARLTESSVYDISGRLIGKSLPAASNRIPETMRNRVLVSINEAGSARIPVSGNQ